MNKNKYTMRGLFLLLFLLINNSSVWSQKSPAVCIDKKTFVITKQKAMVKNEKRPDTVTTTTIVKTDKPTAIPPTEISSFPTIAGGEFGLMNIQPYRSNMNFYNWNYVILQYDITRHGWAENIQIEGSSSQRFVDYVVSKLKKAKWNPALDSNNKAIRHRLYKQVVIVKEKIYEEVFTEDY